MGAAAVIAVDVCDEKLSKMVQLGATHTVNAKREDTVEAIRAATAGRGARSYAYIWESIAEVRVGHGCVHLPACVMPAFDMPSYASSDVS